MCKFDFAGFELRCELVMKKPGLRPFRIEGDGSPNNLLTQVEWLSKND
jgi:hypothetical protein